MFAILCLCDASPTQITLPAVSRQGGGGVNFVAHPPTLLFGSNYCYCITETEWTRERKFLESCMHCEVTVCHQLFLSTQHQLFAHTLNGSVGRAFDTPSRMFLPHGGLVTESPHTHGIDTVALHLLERHPIFKRRQHHTTKHRQRVHPSLVSLLFLLPPIIAFIGRMSTRCGSPCSTSSSPPPSALYAVPFTSGGGSVLLQRSHLSQEILRYA